MAWAISGDALEDSGLTSITLTDTKTGWSATRVLSDEQVLRLTAQVLTAQARAEHTGEKLTYDLSLLFPEAGDNPDASTPS